MGMKAFSLFVAVGARSDLFVIFFECNSNISAKRNKWVANMFVHLLILIHSMQNEIYIKDATLTITTDGF